MGKRILVLSASPRRGGNSDILCDEFIRGAAEAGHRCEKVFLRDQTIGYCTGCGVCNTTHACVQKDGMAALLQKMADADGIVLATPVYFYTMDAQLKTLIDRTVPRYTELSGKEFWFIATAAETDPALLERTMDGLRGFTDCLEGPVERGALRAGGVWEKGKVKGTAHMQAAYRMGKNA